jgi:hypothetical protein
MCFRTYAVRHEFETSEHIRRNCMQAAKAMMGVSGLVSGIYLLDANLMEE